MSSLSRDLGLEISGEAKAGRFGTRFSDERGRSFEALARTAKAEVVWLCHED